MVLFTKYEKAIYHIDKSKSYAENDQINKSIQEIILAYESLENTPAQNNQKLRKYAETSINSLSDKRVNNGIQQIENIKQKLVDQQDMIIKSNKLTNE